MSENLNLFPTSYEASRDRFRESLMTIQQRWPGAQLHSQPLNNFPDISIDWITANAVSNNEKLLLFTTGEHGIEGYTGSAMLQLFTEKYLPQLDASNTALYLVHMIDPWGMKHYRRTNPANVDLNRTFVWDPKLFDPDFNPEYRKIESFVSPQKPLPNFSWASLKFILKLFSHIRKLGKNQFYTVVKLGQYTDPKGLHYGGEDYMEEVLVLQSIFRQAFETSCKILHFDMHTGYGPRYQMTLVDSPLEKRTSAEISQKSGYPLVAAMTPDEFYEVRGDLVDYVYLLRNHMHPETELFSTAFEFGTFGSSFWAHVRMLRAMMFENQVFFYGAKDENSAKKARQEFLEAFFPQAEDWKRKAIADGDQAFAGILKMENYIP